jgi:hypothetical protein
LRTIFKLAALIRRLLAPSSVTAEECVYGGFPVIDGRPKWTAAVLRVMSALSKYGWTLSALPARCGDALSTAPPPQQQQQQLGATPTVEWKECLEPAATVTDLVAEKRIHSSIVCVYTGDRPPSCRVNEDRNWSTV